MTDTRAELVVLAAFTLWNAIACQRKDVASNAVPSTSTSAPIAVSSGSPAPSDSTASDAERQANDGCRFRKNSNRLTHCERAPNGFGSFTPTPDELTRVIRGRAGVCYCTDGLAAAAKKCAEQQKTGLIRFTVGDENDAVDCTLTVSAAESGKRRWLRLHADNRDQATFYFVLTLDELDSSKVVAYYEGFNGMEEPIRAGAKGVSPSLARDWPNLPAPLKKWMREAR